MPNQPPTPEQQAEVLGLKSYALITIITRDLSYCFIGILFWIATGFVLRIGNAEDLTEFTDSTLLVLAAIAVAYPTGRFVHQLGRLPTWVIASHGRLYRNAYVEMLDEARTQLNQAAAWAFNIELPSVEHLRRRREDGEGLRKHKKRIADDIKCLRFVMTQATRFVFMHRPAIYYLSIARSNTLRLMAESTAGFGIGSFLVTSIAIVVSAQGEATVRSEMWYLQAVFFLVGAGSVAIAWRSRKSLVRSEASVFLIVASTIKPDILTLPDRPVVPPPAEPPPPPAAGAAGPRVQEKGNTGEIEKEEE